MDLQVRSGSTMTQCKKCKEEVDEMAQKCPYCGHRDLTSKGQKIETRMRLGVIATVLTLGAALPVVLPLWLWWGRKGDKLKNQGEFYDVTA